ncbi:MAG TPA: LPXTG cell wall anchor domain-containing protein, partial [Clostridia bacterium]|nr:LPXTG cell wall anchor domain-containing protein [Clostridia bacterium]
RIETTASGGKLSAQVSILKDRVPYAGDVTFNNKYSLPQTGDSQPQLMLILAAAGLMALMAGVRLRKKYEN